MVRLDIVYLVRPVTQGAGLSLWHLAETLRGLQQVEEAERHARESLRIWETAFGAGHEWTAWGRISLAEARRLARGDAAEAANQAAQAAAALANTYGADHPVVASTWVLQARALVALQRPADAEALLQRALAVHRAHDDAQGVSAVTELVRLAQGGCAAP